MAWVCDCKSPGQEIIGLPRETAPEQALGLFWVDICPAAESVAGATEVGQDIQHVAQVNFSGSIEVISTHAEQIKKCVQIAFVDVTVVVDVGRSVLLCQSATAVIVETYAILGHVRGVNGIISIGLKIRIFWLCGVWEPKVVVAAEIHIAHGDLWVFPAASS